MMTPEGNLGISYSVGSVSQWYTMNYPYIARLNPIHQSTIIHELDPLKSFHSARIDGEKSPMDMVNSHEFPHFIHPFKSALSGYTVY